MINIDWTNKAQCIVLAKSLGGFVTKHRDRSNYNVSATNPYCRNAIVSGAAEVVWPSYDEVARRFEKAGLPLK
jgi:hypothetical protein